MADLLNVNKYLKGGERQMDEAKFFLMVCSDRTRSNGLKLEHRKFCANMQKNFFMVGMTEHWSRLPREVVGGGVSFCGDIQDPAGC